MSSSEIPIINNNNEKNQSINDFNENINKENININNTNNTLNHTESNQNKIMSSREWINYFNQSKINLEEINNVLLSNVESIDNENTKLKEALNELIKDLKEKEETRSRLLFIPLKNPSSKNLSPEVSFGACIFFVKMRKYQQRSGKHVR